MSIKWSSLTYKCVGSQNYCTDSIVKEAKAWAPAAILPTSAQSPKDYAATTTPIIHELPANWGLIELQFWSACSKEKTAIFASYSPRDLQPSPLTPVKLLCPAASGKKATTPTPPPLSERPTKKSDWTLPLSKFSPFSPPSTPRYRLYLINPSISQIRISNRFEIDSNLQIAAPYYCISSDRNSLGYQQLLPCP